MARRLVGTSPIGSAIRSSVAEAANAPTNRAPSVNGPPGARTRCAGVTHGVEPFLATHGLPAHRLSLYHLPVTARHAASLTRWLASSCRIRSVTFDLRELGADSR